jgi:hypothetical protein
MTPPPTASVILPTRDRWPRLRLALRSALNQTVRDIEVIVVDDGSRDETPVQLAAIDDPRVVVLRSARSEGVARARNAALARARGRWIAFLDDDDLWAPWKLERQLAVAAETDADFVSTAAVKVTEDGIVLGRLHPHIDDLERGLVRGNVIGGLSTVMVKAGLLEALGGFDEQLAVVADWELWLRLAGQCRPAAVEEPLTAVIHHGTNMQVTAIDGVAAELHYLMRRHAAHAARLDVEFGSESLEQWFAHTHRRAGHAGQAATAYLRLARRRPLYGLVRALICTVEGVTGRQLPARRTPREPAPAWLAEAGVGPVRNAPAPVGSSAHAPEDATA